MKFHIPIENIHLEGTLSQNVDICPSFFFMIYRKIIIKNNKNLPVFCHKNETRTYINILRNGSLQMDVINILLNFENNGCHINREILDQKLKVKK